MRNDINGIREKLNGRSLISFQDTRISRSEEEVPVVKKETSGPTPSKTSTRASNAEIAKDLDKLRQQHLGTDVADDEKELTEDPKYLAKLKNFYIVEGETCAELYRTDMLHRMKQEEESDASSDDEMTFVRMADRWKEEWNRGVQLPLHDKLPEFIVEDAPCSSSAVLQTHSPSLNSDDLLISVHNRRYVGEKHKHVTMPKLRHYQTDKADRLYLCKLNEKRAEYGLPEISEKTFGAVMSELEVSCYQAMHNDLLLPLISSAAYMGTECDENACCDICRQPDYEEDDEIIFCDGCNLSVHQSCYGLDVVPSDEWLCMKCKILGFSAFPQCVLCPLTGGAIKCTKDGTIWAHVACALWIREVRFTDIDHREPISNICDIPYERCTVCDTKQGACIQCSVATCTNAFHVSCALRSGQVMRIEHEGEDDDDGVRMVSLCRQHSQEMHPSSLLPNNMELSSAGTLTLQEMERMFFLYVAIEDIAKMLFLSEDVVSDIYEYWKLRRIDNGYKPLLGDRTEVERQTIQHLNSPSIVFSNNFRQETLIRQNLEKVRNLCYMVGKREKLKLESLQCWMKTYKCVFETLVEKNVPYSTRTLERFLRAISWMQPAHLTKVDPTVTPENPSVPPSLKIRRSSSSSRKLPVRHIRGKNDSLHNLRKNVTKRIPLAVNKSTRNSVESFTSGRYSLRGLV